MESSELRFETTTPIREFRRWFRGRPSYTREQLREFAKDAGRPVKVDARTQRRLKQLLAAGRSQAEVRRGTRSLTTYRRASGR
jgi:hypothetical protein